ncbi:MAG: hypothetical protein PVH41_00015 [Anaerolineae bacterium]|jgi:hypothetical protein
MAFSQDLDIVRTGGTAFSDFEVGRVYAQSALMTTQLAAYIRALGWPALGRTIYATMACRSFRWRWTQGWESWGAAAI